MTKRNEQVEDATIMVGCEEGDRIFNQVLEDYPVMDKNDMRRSTIMLSLLTSAAVYLHMSGWSVKDLVNEVFDHCEIVDEWLNTDDDDE